MSRAPIPVLGHGRWFGRPVGSSEVGAFSVAELEPQAWGSDLPEHSHSEPHLILPIAGRYVSSAVGAPEICDSNIVIFNPKGVVHRDRFESSAGRFMGVSVRLERLSTFDLKHLPVDALAVRSVPVLRAMHAIRLERSNWDACSSLVVEGLCLELLGLISREHRSFLRKRPDWINTAVHVLHDHVGSNLTIPELARLLGVGESELNVGFRKFLRTSPGILSRSIRMQQAEQLLADKTMSLADVGLAVGYSEQSAFNKAFRRHSGLTPGSFRKKHGKLSDKDKSLGQDSRKRQR